MDKQIIVYKSSDGSELPVRTDGETVWMTIEQMTKMFGRDRTVLIRHVNIGDEAGFAAEGNISAIMGIDSIK